MIAGDALFVFAGLARFTREIWATLLNHASSIHFIHSHSLAQFGIIKCLSLTLPRLRIQITVDGTILRA